MTPNCSLHKPSFHIEVTGKARFNLTERKWGLFWYQAGTNPGQALNQVYQYGWDTRRKLSFSLRRHTVYSRQKYMPLRHNGDIYILSVWLHYEHLTPSRSTQN